MKSTHGFTRRAPDYVSEELVSVLSERTTFEFKPLFLRVHAQLRARNAASGGEDMLRLRTYEKLQGLVRVGAVTKTGKEYVGVAAGLARLAADAAAATAAVNARLKVAAPVPPSGVSRRAPALATKPKAVRKTPKTARAA
jgi:hypothetical protein